MNDFLPQLKKLQPITSAKGGKTMTGKEIFFLIKTGENDAFIIPVDKKLKPVDADYHYYSGDTAQLLRSIDAIKEEMAFQFSWDDENEANDVSLSQNPHLLYHLPDNWVQFFRDIKKRCKPMKAPKKKYSLLQIPNDDKDLQHIILTDPTIRKYTLKAEGFILLVETTYKSKVVDALKKYGYLI